MSGNLIVVSGTVVGADEVVEHLGIIAPGHAIERMRDAVHRLGYVLETKVRAEKLNGVVLKRRSGRLARSVNTRFSGTATSETASVGTSLKYGRIWELTGSRAFVIVPRKKRALFWAGANNPVAKVMHPAQSPRPFLRPALVEMRPIIQPTIAAAMRNL